LYQEYVSRASKQSLNLVAVFSEFLWGEEEILETAMELKITFYDACYAYFAKVKELSLVTEDSRLIKKVSATINVSTLDDIK